MHMYWLIVYAIAMQELAWLMVAIIYNIFTKSVA